MRGLKLRDPIIMLTHEKGRGSRQLGIFRHTRIARIIRTVRYRQIFPVVRTFQSAVGIAQTGSRSLVRAIKLRKIEIACRRVEDRVGSPIAAVPGHP